MGKSKKKPRLVESVGEESDEEIPEDDAFNSDDERKFGAFFDKSDGSDEDITSDEDNDESEDGSGAEEEEDDGGQYMLDLLEKLDAKGDSETKEEQTKPRENLTLDALMEGLQDTKGFNALQKTMKKIVVEGKPVPAPLARVVASREERKVSYQNQAKEISLWGDAVQENRQAETLDFRPKVRLQETRDTIVGKFVPTTPFEKELHKALEEAGQKDDEAVLQKEKEMMDDLGSGKLTMEEYKKRRGQLAKMRALMFYHEKKRHQIKKIKSKKYRRIRKKQRERVKEAEMSAQIDQNPDLEKELQEKEEVERIQERMTLAHKNTSKWAKRILKRGKNVDLDTRRALSAQLKRGDDLRRKMASASGQHSSDSEDEDLAETARKVLMDTEDDAPGDHGERSGLFKLSFMQRGIEKQRNTARQEAQKLLEELEEEEEDDYDKAVAGDDVDEEKKSKPKQKKVASAAEMKDVLPEGALVAKSLEFGGSDEIAVSGGIQIDLGRAAESTSEPAEPTDKAEGLRQSATSEHTSTIEVASVAAPNNLEKGKEKRSKKRKGKPTSIGNQDLEESNPWLQNTDKASQPDKKKSKQTSAQQTGVVDVEEVVDGLDVATSTTKPSNVEKVKSKSLENMTQEELVRRAFVTSEEDAEAEFAKEKEAMVGRDESNKEEKESEKTVAGWGSWAGEGAPKPRRQKLPKKLKPPAKKQVATKRKDSGRPNVIVNQKRIRRTAATLMTVDVPYPYTSRAEYERSMMGGLGREWNVTSGFKNMTRPEVITRSGKIIQPISSKVKKPRPAAKF